MAAGQFRSYTWDPILLISQMIAMQTTFYLTLGIWLQAVDTLVGRHISLQDIFGFKDIDFSVTAGRLYIAAFASNSITTALALWFIVQRAKLCLDFTCTVHVIHLMCCWLVSGFPSTWSWWMLNVGCITLTAVLSEYLCLRYELKAIPVTTSGVSWKLQGKWKISEIGRFHIISYLWGPLVIVSRLMKGHQREITSGNQ